MKSHGFELGPTNQRRRRRWLTVATNILLISIAVTYFSYQAISILGAKRLEDAFAEADRLDPGWRMKDLESKRPYPETDKNGYHQVRRIKAAMPAGDWPEWPFPQFDQDATYLHTVRSAIHNSLIGDRLAPCLLNAEELRVLRAEMARAAKAIELARTMPEYPYGRSIVRWTKDYSSTPMAGIREVLAVANLLSYDARLRSHDNDIEGALHDIKAMLFASRSLGDDPRLAAALIRVGCDRIACGALERCLTCGRASEKTLVDLQREFEREAEVPLHLLAIRGERAGCELQLENIQKGEIPINEFYRMDADLDTSYLSSFWWPDEGPPSAFQKNLEFVRKFASMQDERAKMLRFMNEQVEFGKLPPWEKIRATEAKVKSLESGHSSQRGLCLTYFHLAQTEAEFLAILRTANTALALERFHLAHGRWPDRLQDLAPQYLSALPLDPFDGAPLRIVRRGSAVVAYSISRNGEDHGETIFDVTTIPGSNFGFMLHDPSQRRRPAKSFEFPKRSAAETPEVDPDDERE